MSDVPVESEEAVPADQETDDTRLSEEEAAKLWEGEEAGSTPDGYLHRPIWP